MAKKVLIVEDETFLAKVWKAKLEKEGFEVVMDYKGSQAFKIAETEQPDLILLDVGLPDENGFNILKNLKSNKKTARIPVLMVTRLGDEEDITSGVNGGADEYLVKSNVSFRTIIDAVTTYLDGAKLQKKKHSICKSCKKKTMHDAVFCSYCGTKL